MTELNLKCISRAMKDLRPPTPQEELEIRKKRLANMVEELRSQAAKFVAESKANMDLFEAAKRQGKECDPYFGVAVNYRNMSIVFDDHADRIFELNLSVARYGLKF